MNTDLRQAQDKLTTTSLFFFSDTATTEIYTLSLHDALPIYRVISNDGAPPVEAPATSVARMLGTGSPLPATTPRLAISFSKLPCRPSPPGYCRSTRAGLDRKSTRLNSSHTVISYAVFCLTKK